MSWAGHDGRQRHITRPDRRVTSMTEARPATVGPAAKRARMPSWRGSPQPPVASDSYHALDRDSSAAGRRAGHVRLEPAPGRYAAGMTAAPARHRDNGVDATAGATAHARQAGDELAARRRRAPRWTPAGISLIYLSPPRAALSD